MPKWPNEYFDIDVRFVGDDLLMQCFDEDIFDSELIGEATIKLTALCYGKGVDDWFDI